VGGTLLIDEVGTITLEKVGGCQMVVKSDGGIENWRVGHLSAESPE
jgi:hypothetical protein